MLCPVWVSAGCSSTGTPPRDEPPAVRAFDEDARAILGTPIDESGQLVGKGVTPDAPVWSIVLFRAPGDDRAAGEQLAEAARDAGIDGVRLQDRGNGLFVVAGAYDDPTSAAASRHLDRVRSTRVGQNQPFRQAYLAPPPESDATGTDPRMDLRNAKTMFGADALYTLQVAIYGRNDQRAPTGEELAAFRAAAEEAARTLRAQGDVAFYYHSPQRSMVTVGVFTPEDHDPTTHPPFESIALRTARKKHPNNLFNGQGIKETSRDARGQPVERLQPSFLVKIPDAPGGGR